MLQRIFLNGLKTVVPVAVTLAIVIWLFQTIESLFRYLLQDIIGIPYYFPGLGFLIGLAFVFVIGMIMNAWIAQKIYGIGERLIKRIPLIKTLYSSLEDFMQFFDTKKKKEAKQHTVMVRLPIGNILGFVTREDFDDLPKGIGSKKDVAVYIPMSYQIGGFTVIIPKKDVIPIDMDVQKAMSFALMAGISGSKKK